MKRYFFEVMTQNPNRRRADAIRPYKSGIFRTVAPLASFLLIGLLSLVLALGADAAVTLLYFRADPQPNGTIRVSWETATEFNTLYFQLFHGLSETGPWGDPIDQQPARGDGVTGAVYQYTDSDVMPGVTYYYLLKEFASDTSGETYGPVQARVEPPATATPTLTATLATDTPEVQTPTETATFTPQPTAASATASPTRTPTRTRTPTWTPSRTPTRTPPEPPTATRQFTNTPRPTNTALPATAVPPAPPTTTRPTATSTLSPALVITPTAPAPGGPPEPGPTPPGPIAPPTPAEATQPTLTAAPPPSSTATSPAGPSASASVTASPTGPAFPTGTATPTPEPVIFSPKVTGQPLLRQTLSQPTAIPALPPAEQVVRDPRLILLIGGVVVGVALLGLLALLFWWLRRR